MVNICNMIFKFEKKNIVKHNFRNDYKTYTFKYRRASDLC